MTVEGDVEVRQVTDDSWMLLAPLRWRGDVATPGTPTDFASVPRPFVWLLPRYGRWTKAAILHDLYWRSAVPSGAMTRREADRRFREMQVELDVAFLRRWFMWAAVRVGALAHADGRRGWWRDAPRVLAVALLAVPVVAPPAILILASLVLFYLMERVAWLALLISRVAGRRRQRVNSPSLLIKT